MLTTIGSHLPEDSLMRYSLGTLPEPELANLEEHILLCASCQNRLTAMDELLRVGAQAAKELRQEDKARVKQRGFWWLKSGPTLLCASALTACLIYVAIPSLRGPATGPAATTEVSLVASRGAAQALVSHARAGHIMLNMDLSELPSLPSYRVQVVDASGREIWSGKLPSVRQQIHASIPYPLPSGQYWVRLFGPDQAQLREFGLQVD